METTQIKCMLLFEFFLGILLTSVHVWVSPAPPIILNTRSTPIGACFSYLRISCLTPPLEHEQYVPMEHIFHVWWLSSLYQTKLAPPSLAQNMRQRGPVLPAPLHLVFWWEGRCSHHSHPLHHLKCKTETLAPLHLAFQCKGGCLNHLSPPSQNTRWRQMVSLNQKWAIESVSGLSSSGMSFHPCIQSAKWNNIIFQMSVPQRLLLISLFPLILTCWTCFLFRRLFLAFKSFTVLPLLLVRCLISLMALSCLRVTKVGNITCNGYPHIGQ